MTTVVGVIGTGNMGSALVKGWSRGGAADPTLVVWDKAETAVRSLLAGDGTAGCGPISPLSSVFAAGSLEALLAQANIVVVVVKPKDAPEVLGTLSRLARKEQIVVSAMAGLTLDWLREALGPGPELLRIMPNLGVELGAGAVAVAAEAGGSAAALEKVVALFRLLGLVEVLPEELFDVVTAVSGSSPAFLAVAIEGLEDGAVAAGLSRAAARTVVRQAALGTARLLPEYEDSAADLRQRLASAGELEPGAMNLLEERGVRDTFRLAVAAAIERSRQMRKI